MTESEFITLSEHVMHYIEVQLEKVADDTDLDVECSRNGNLLDIEFVENGSHIIINTQLPMRELWMATPRGGYHFRYDGTQWLDSRSQKEFFASLTEQVSEQGGLPVTLTA